MEYAVIYTLSDPCDGDVRYIGRTTQTPALRLMQHVWRDCSHIPTCARARWIKALGDAGLKPIIAVVETVPMDQAGVAERRWVHHYHQLGANLTNNVRVGGGATRSHVLKWDVGQVGMLGTAPDEAVARSLGVTRKTVAYHRRARGIAASGDRSATVPPPPMAGWNRKALPPEIMVRLGAEPDYQIAADLGVDKGVIARARRARGIAPYATTTGRTGQFQRGHFPARWLKRS